MPVARSHTPEKQKLLTASDEYRDIAPGSHQYTLPLQVAGALRHEPPCFSHRAMSASYPGSTRPPVPGRIPGHAASGGRVFATCRNCPFNDAGRGKTTAKSSDLAWPALAELMPGLFQVGISAVIEGEDGRILLLHRNATKDFGAQEWEPVSGRVEAGETIEQAVRREVREETGLVVVALNPFDTFAFERLGVELLGIAFACHCRSGVLPQTSDEHDAQRWVSEREMLDLELNPRVRKTLDLYWRRRAAMHSTRGQSERRD